jgi:CHASE3 domain sensor protein
VLYERYEQAWDEFHRIEAATPRNPATRDDDALKSRLQDAAAANQREIDALRHAMLYQLPKDAADAVLLAAQLWTTFGLTDDFDATEDDPDRLAFETGLETLLDFLMGEADDLQPGYQLATAERLVRSRRQLRTGMVVPAS